MMVSSHRVLNECTLWFVTSTFKISLRFKTDSSVSLTLKCSLDGREDQTFLHESTDLLLSTVRDQQVLFLPLAAAAPDAGF